MNIRNIIVGFGILCFMLTSVFDYLEGNYKSSALAFIYGCANIIVFYI